MPAAPDDWRRMGQEQFLTGVVLERRQYAPPDQRGLRAWRSQSRKAVVQGFGASPPSGGVFATRGSVDDWEEVDPPHPWDHDHCEFCGAKFMAPGQSTDPEVLSEGYASLDPDADHWICDVCFTDFRGEFEWTVRGA